MNRLQKLWYSCKEIGIPQIADYAVYFVQKKTGCLTRSTPLGGIPLDFKSQEIEIKIPFTPFNPELLELIKKDRSNVLQTADELLSGWYHPFCGKKEVLSFTIGMESFHHWSMVGDQINGLDIKWLWEPARFSWAFDLAKAWMITKDDRYVIFFWQKFSEFNTLNQVNSAPNWTSAQEAAMRIIVWLMVYQVFKESPITTAEHTSALIIAIWQHAARIPPTLGYARSQNNNHLLSEALGLVIAGSLFAEKSTLARDWLQTGVKEFNNAILKQIELDGTYLQHSTNYHRLMLQLAMVYLGYAKQTGSEIPSIVTDRLTAATRWMAAQLDPISGRLPNLGHNDGSLLLPMGNAEFRDYRPTLKAAGLAFMEDACLPNGQWDELVLWLGFQTSSEKNDISSISSTAIHVVQKEDIKAILRGVTFHGRPAHADQLHLELWWDGFNVAQDAGTFSYNDPPPWQNPFSSTLVHNTISVDNQDQMTKASKFLWLRQTQAKWQAAPSKDILMASHDGYRQVGVTHQRIVTFVDAQQIEVVDQVHFIRKTDVQQVVLHWLLLDWQWQLGGNILSLTCGDRQVKITFHAILKDDATLISPLDVSIIRGGESLKGKLQNPVLGWASDTYGEKHPILSLSIQYQTNIELQIITRFEFIKSSSDSQG